MPETDEFDAIETLDDPESDQHVRLNRADVERMRKAAKQGKADRKELEGIRRQSAIVEAGLTDLNPAQRTALSKLVEDASPENLRAEAEALGWVQPAPPDPNAVTDAELDAHTQVSQVSAGAPAVTASRHVTPADTAEWSTEKHLRLNDRYPQLHEALRRGQEIDLPPDFN